MNERRFLSRRSLVILGVTALLLVIGAFYLRSQMGLSADPVEIKLGNLEAEELARNRREIQYNATVSLAVKGSKNVRLDLLQEMLDEPKQLRNFWVKLDNGRVVSNETAARTTILNALKAVVAWHKKLDVAKVYGPDNKDVQKIYKAIDNLAKNSPNQVIRKEAYQAQQALGRA